MSIAKAAAAPAAASREESLVWPRIAAPVVAAADEAADEAAEEDESVVDAVAPVAVDAAVASVEVSVLVEVTEPLRVVSVVVLLVAEAVVAAPVLELEQTTAEGRSVTPPRAQIFLATSRVAVAQRESRSANKQAGGG